MNAEELDQIVLRVQNGDREAFAEVVFAIRRELRIFLSAHASSITMVEEVLQTTFITLYENIAKYERRGTFIPWAKGMARNLLLKELHARSRDVTSDGDLIERIMLRSAVESTKGMDREEEYAEKLRGCLKELPEISHRLVQQRYFDGLSVKAIAKLTNRTETWTAVALFRIRDLLRKCMMKEVTP
ncbi:MAG: sigma-70 family RNA polymerase sigma factor [bacterium]